jgi:hypothetical protein
MWGAPTETIHEGALEDDRRRKATLFVVNERSQKHANGSFMGEACPTFHSLPTSSIASSHLG